MTNIKVFDKNWFKKYNKWIVKLAKIPFIGEWVFCFKKYGHYFDIDNLVEVQPNAVVEDMKLMWTKCVRIKGQWVAYDCNNSLHNRLIKKEFKEKLLPTRRNHYFVRNEYALRLQSVFYPIWITFHIWDIITRPIPQLNLGFDTLTVYPDASSGSTTCDGGVQWGGSDTFANAINAANGSTSQTNYTSGACTLVYSGTSTNIFGAIQRDFFTFDTSSLTSGATISGAVFSLRGLGAAYSELGSDSVHACLSTQTNNNNLSTSDYQNQETTSFGSIAFSSWSTSGYNDITFNASGVSSVSKTGITKLCTMSTWDISSSFTGTWAKSKYSEVDCYFSDNGSNKPKLVVTYTTVVGPANVKTYKGLAAASVKTCKGLAIASVKSKKGLV